LFRNNYVLFKLLYKLDLSGLGYESLALFVIVQINRRVNSNWWEILIIVFRLLSESLYNGNGVLLDPPNE